MILRDKLSADWLQQTEVRTRPRKSLHQHHLRLGKSPEVSHQSQYGQRLRSTVQQTCQPGKLVGTRLSNDPMHHNAGNGSLRYAAEAHHDL